MTTEDLLKPRYKLTAPYPGSDWEVGEVITFENDSQGRPVHHHWDRKGRQSFAPFFFDEYPHLFQKLEWWEERKESEMPKYVKGLMATVKGKLFKVCDRDQNGRAFHNETEIELAYLIKYGNFFLPATEAEFNSQNKPS